MSHVEGADISKQDILQDNDDTTDRKLQDIFRGSSVLLTGCTGFLGSVVFEKLLRSCPRIRKVILLVRNVNDEQATLQYKTLCRTRLFDRIKMENPQAFDKVQVMSCNPSRPNLGLCQQNVDTITSSVNIVIHADLLQIVDAGLKESVLVNLLMTKHLLQLAAKSRNIEAFVHLSSTLSHFEERLLEERFYTPPLSPEGLLAVVSHLPDDTVEDITTGLLGEFPAPCILTQNVAEEIVRLEGKSLPLGIIRLPLLLASCKEPLAGWGCDCEVVSVIMNILLGYVRTLHCQQNLLSELVPVDMAANLVIAVAGNIAKTRQEWVNHETEVCRKKSAVSLLERCSESDSDTTKIYNLVSSNHKPITWKEFYSESLRHGNNVPFTDMVWCVRLFITENRTLYTFYAFIVHIIPAILVDKISGFFGRQSRLYVLYTFILFVLPAVLLDKISWFFRKQSRLLKVYEDIQPTCDLVSFYSTHQQRYRDNNVRDLWAAMSVSDQQVFDFNMKDVDWDEYFYTQCRGIRVYTLKGSLDTVGAAKIRKQRLTIAHVFSVVAFNLATTVTFFFLIKFFIKKI